MARLPPVTADIGLTTEAESSLVGQGSTLYFVDHRKVLRGVSEGQGVWAGREHLEDMRL